MKKDIIKGEIMKKNKIFVLGLIVTFVAFISLSLVSSTWAKYTSSVSSTSTATVAKWSFDSVDLSAKTIEFNLFNTILDTDDQTEGENGKETDVAPGRIAPGTKGSASFTFKNTGEVNAVAIVTLKLINDNGIPLAFTLGGETLFKTENSYTDTIKLNMDTDGATWELNWEWVFSKDKANDTADTTLGTLTTAPEVLVELSVEFVQVD